MYSEVVHRCKGGKTIRVLIELEDDVIVDVSITGDFFMEPEEGIERLNEFIKGKKLNELKLDRFFKEHKIKLVGATPNDFYIALMKTAKVKK